jgi:type III secretion protein U
MSNNTSEEKTLPASPKKLKDLRKKGKIPRSPDMVAAATFTAACGFLALTADRFSNNFRSTAQYIFGFRQSDFNIAALDALNALGLQFGYYLALLLVIVISLAIVTNIVMNRGVLFSMEPMKFDLNKLNPVEGFKRIFSMRTAVDLAKNTVKVTLLLVFCLIALANGLQAAFFVPFCGSGCLGSVARQMALPLIIIAVVILLVAGLIDVLVQRWLFLRDQRMTKTEVKRERKDEEGSPEVRLAQRRLRRGFLQRFSKYTAEDATIFIEGFSTVVGIRFIRNETPLPIVICKGKGNQAGDLLIMAQAQRTAIYFDDEFATGLAQRVEIGSSLTETFFEPFIKALKASGQL